MDRVLLVGLMEIDLRDGRSIHLCDGGFLTFDGDVYESSDAEFGVIGAMETFSEGQDNVVPAFRLTFLPASTAAAADISAPGMQRSPARFWIAELDPSSGTIIGTPDLMFDGMIDSTTLRIGRAKRELDIDFVSNAERLFAVNEGNTLSARAHKAVFPGELGEDNATGIGVQVAWGTEAAPGAAQGGYYGAGYGGGNFFGNSGVNFV